MWRKSLRLSISCLSISRPSISSQDTQCQKRYLTRSSLKQYKAVSDKQQQICQPKRRYQCNKCPKLFSRPFCLKHHQLSHHSVGKSLRLHPKQKYRCKVCHKRLATKSYLKVHLRFYCEAMQLAYKYMQTSIFSALLTWAPCMCCVCMLIKNFRPVETSSSKHSHAFESYLQYVC